MKVPSKITPDRIRDSIVQVFFQSGIPFEPLIGIIYSALTKAGWKYANRPNQSQLQKGLIIEFASTQQHFFIKDQIRLELFSNQSIAFNCNNNYIGWDSYSKYIREVFDALYAAGHFKNFSRVGIRYISEFSNIDILEKINFKVSSPDVEGTISNSSYRFTFQEKDVLKTINIASKLPVNALLAEANEPVKFVSLIDVDIVQANLNCQKIDELFSTIDSLHIVEKKIFFGMLSDEYLQTLNPEYA